MNNRNRFRFRKTYTFGTSQKSFGHILSLLLLLTFGLYNKLCFAFSDFFPSDICLNFLLIFSLLRDIIFIRALNNHLPLSDYLLFNNFNNLIIVVRLLLLFLLLKLIRYSLNNFCNRLFRNILFLGNSKRIIMFSFSPFFPLAIYFKRSTFVLIFKALILL